MEYLFIFLASGLIWEAMKWCWKSLRHKGQILGGMRVTFTATVDSHEDGMYLLEHIVNIPVPEGKTYTMYDVDYRVEK